MPRPLRTLGVLLLALAGLASGAGEPARLYDRYGRLQGTLESDGRFYDRYGRQQWRLEPDGRLYDRYGQRLGRFGQMEDRPMTPFFGEDPAAADDE